VRKREREREGEREGGRERERERGREGEREGERERGREKEGEGERKREYLFLKGMTGALAPFSYLVQYKAERFAITNALTILPL
jgi:hypothetical protein